MQRLSILLPSIGRPSVRRTLASIASQVEEGDEVLLLSDGPVSDELRSAWAEARLPGMLLEVPEGPHRDWGHTPRNWAMPRCSGDMILHIDDDDVYVPQAFRTIRNAIKTHVNCFLIFRMLMSDGSVLWRKESIELGNVGTPMFVHPRLCGWGTWTPRVGGDFDFIRQTVVSNPDIPVRWLRDHIVEIRPRQARAHAAAGATGHVPGSNCIKTLIAVHPNWRGGVNEIRLFDNGRMDRPGFDVGSYEYEVGQRIVLKWDRWPIERLFYDRADRLYRDESKPFTLQDPMDLDIGGPVVPK